MSSEESKEEDNSVFYFANDKGNRRRLSKEDWEREWLNWWNKIQREKNAPA